jgi:hypothetical protein
VSAFNGHRPRILPYDLEVRRARRSTRRRSLLVIMLCAIAGGLVGWLLSLI